MPRSIDEQLTKYLTDAHSIEEQALVQMKAAPKIAGDPDLAGIFEVHARETEGHEQRVRARLEAHDASPSTLKDLVMKAGGSGFALFAQSQPDTPGKLVAHAYSYEHLELAAYELLRRVAERAGDSATAEAARAIAAEEQAMADGLEARFDLAAELSLREVGAQDLQKQITKYLTDAHAIEAQAIQLLQGATKIAGQPALADAYAEHLEQSREHQRLVGERLEARGAKPSAIKDAGLRLGAINWATFFGVQPDRAGKLAAFSFAFEHLEIAGYEQLRRVAQRAGDQETIRLAERILPEERTAAEKVAAHFDDAVEASLEAVGVA